MKHLPSDLGLLRSLSHLYVCRCTDLESVPATFCQLAGLDHLCLKNTCDAFRSSVPKGLKDLPGCDACNESDFDDWAIDNGNQYILFALPDWYGYEYVPDSPGWNGHEYVHDNDNQYIPDTPDWHGYGYVYDNDNQYIPDSPDWNGYEHVYDYYDNFDGGADL